MARVIRECPRCGYRLQRPSGCGASIGGFVSLCVIIALAMTALYFLFEVI